MSDSILVQIGQISIIIKQFVIHSTEKIEKRFCSK